MQEPQDTGVPTAGFMESRPVEMFGAVAFLLGFTLAIFSGWLWPENGRLAATVVVMGVVVGLLNITGREVVPFLVAAVALVVIGQGDVFTPLNNLVAGLGDAIDSVVNHISLFAAPAALVNAVRIAIALGRPGRGL